MGRWILRCWHFGAKIRHVRFNSLILAATAKKAVFDLTPQQILQQTDSERSKLPNIDTNLIINNFLQSVMYGDYNRSQQILSKLALRIQLNYQKNNSSINYPSISSYYSCTLILLCNLINQEHTLNVNLVKSIVDKYQEHETELKKLKNVPKDVLSNKHEIHLKIIHSLIICFNNVSGRGENLIKPSLANYMKVLIKDFNLNVDTLLEQIGPNDALQLSFIEICKLNGIKLSVQSFKSEDTIDTNILALSQIEPFKDENNHLSLDSLCNYILSTRFPSSNVVDKLYNIYDNLSSAEKDKFMHDYLEFNKLKQINVELHCLDLVEDLSSIEVESNRRNSKRLINFNRFKNQQHKLLYSWYQENSQTLINIINKVESAKAKDLNDDEKVIAKYILHLKLIPRNVLINLITSTLLSMTISIGYVKLPDLVRNLSVSFQRILYKEPTFSSIKHQLFQFFKLDVDGSILFSSLIKLFLPNFCLELQKEDLNALNELCNLNNKDISKIFLTPDGNSKFPAFHHSMMLISGHTTGVISIHPYLSQVFQSSDKLTLNKQLYLPMLYPPKKWTSPTEGGYLSDLKPIVKSIDFNTCMAYLGKADETGQLSSTYTGLNELGKTAWAINARSFDIFDKVMDYEEGFLTIPPKLSEIGNTLKEEHELRSKRIEYNLIRRVAKCYNENGDIFYLPHNLDFRGRAYPMVSILSHYQEDLVRALMMFWHSKPLGPEGFNWVKYQLAGVFGKDKLRMDERLRFVDENIDNIIDSARNPLEGNMWWKTAEKPWQTLSLCMEVESILRFQENGGNLSTYLCRIPIHQDGSCNGLQHYAALGADLEGGKSVNLVPIDGGKTRGDVYSTVLNLVEQKVNSDCVNEMNENYHTAMLAKSILSRKLIKQTVMTTVYGVTQYGGTQQINQRIKDLLLVHKMNQLSLELYDNIDTHQRKISIYLSQIVLSSISELFSNAKLIQDWLVDNSFRVLCSFDLPTVKYVEQNLIKSRGYNFMNPILFKPLMWTSMSGFPVIQLYRNIKPTNVKTTLQNITLRKPNMLSSINKRKQLNGIAPNFVHSIDAIHMFMTCVAAKKQNVPFVSVHDSFWTYPSDTAKLSVILREEFIRLHSGDIISQLRDDLLYTTRNSYQLVWIRNEDNIELINELKHMRDQYPRQQPSHKVDKQKYSIRSKTQLYNNILWTELNNLTEGKTDTPLKLIEKFQPTLYFKSKNSQNVRIYTKDNFDGKEYKFLIKAFTPVLVPVRILPCPPTGKLDINEVRNSPFFFA